MNLVGKILTGLIALFSVVFMTLVLAVYATHTNWREKTLAVEKERDQQRTENATLKTKNDELEKTLVEEKKTSANSIAALRETSKSLQQQSDQQKKALEKVDAERAAALSTLDITQKNQTDFYAQVHGGKDKDGKDHKGLLNDVTEERKAREAWLQRALAAQDQVQQLQNVLATLKNRQQTLLADARKYRDILLQHNLSLNVEEKEAPDVKGRVTAVSAAGLVEIDIGRDAGLRQGHQLHVYRAAGIPYLGKVEVIETQPERAVCKVLREFQKGPIQRDDHVAAQIRFQ
jgi:hypothetical protein